MRHGSTAKAGGKPGGKTGGRTPDPKHAAGRALRLTRVPRRERPILLVAGMAVVALTTMAITGGPSQPQVRETSPQIARLIDEHDLQVRARPAPRPSGSTVALVRLPDRPQALTAYFSAMNYGLDQVREGGPEVPRVYLQEVPSGLADYGPVERKKALFVRMMLPLVLKANERVERTRARVERLADALAGGETLPDTDRRWLLHTAERYGVDAETAAEIDVDALLQRVDAVPPSLAITQSILESGWGSSRFARKGNALFGQRTWDADTPGMDPSRADGFKVRAFDRLGASVESYVHNLNTSAAYAQLRRERAAMRARGERIDGYRLASTLLKYSEEGGHYVEKLRGLMAHNGLRAFDDAELRRQTIAQRVIPDNRVADIQVALAPEPGS